MFFPKQTLDALTYLLVEAFFLNICSLTGRIIFHDTFPIADATIWNVVCTLFQRYVQRFISRVIAWIIAQ